jgi:hypothetical protein
MNAEEIRQWIVDPSQMNRESMLQLKALLEEYPCFTVARMVYLKNLLNLNDLHFSAALNQTAIAVPDRRRLYYFIEGKQLPENMEKPKPDRNESGGFSLIDRYLSGSIPKETKEPEAVIPLSETDGKPFFEKPEESFSDKIGDEAFILDYAGFLSRQAEPKPATPAEPMNGQDLIDRFLEKTGKQEASFQIQTPLPVETSNRPDDETGDPNVEQVVAPQNLAEDSFTETLARIYLKQKRYDRALEIFRNLILKYPEKSVYFADQIRFLEKLIINIKK